MCGNRGENLASTRGSSYQAILPIRSKPTANGILMRSDLHKLFDLGYISVSPDLHVEVSRKIKEEYENGRDYYALHGKVLVVTPTAWDDRPSGQFLQWHNQNVYLG
jgi:putative restriction endonuclease